MLFYKLSDVAFPCDTAQTESKSDVTLAERVSQNLKEA